MSNKSRQTAPHPGTTDTPAEAPAIEHAPDSAAQPGTSADLPDIQMEVQKVAPAYEFFLFTIRDHFGVESRWLIPGTEVLGPEELEVLISAHVRMSQAETRRN